MFVFLGGCDLCYRCSAVDCSERLVFKMTYCVSRETSKSAHLLYSLLYDFAGRLMLSTFVIKLFMFVWEDFLFCNCNYGL